MKETSPDVVRCYTLERMNIAYTESERIHVYTDSSYFYDLTTVGSKVFSDRFSLYA